MTKLWEFAKQNFDVLLTIVAAIIVIILDLWNIVQPDIVAAATLMILSLIGVSLLLNRVAVHRLQATTERMLARLQKPSIDEILLPYKRWMEDIETNLASANEVWVLSRTCTRFWEDYRNLLQGILDRNGCIRLLLVDPHNGALKMIANSIELARSRDVAGQRFLKVIPADGTNRLALLQAQVEDFVKYVAGYSSQVGAERLALRMIDYLPAHTLVIVNGASEQGVIFVELGTFHSDGRSRPTFSLRRIKESQLYSLYIDEYQAMWEYARPLDGNYQSERSGM
jgi:hypothetical protein